MKTIIKLLIAIALINAAARVGMAYASFYQLKDQAQELLTFGAKVSPEQIQSEILSKAASLNLQLDPSEVQVTRDGLRIVATTAFTRPVEVFPNYQYPIDFKFSVDAVSMGGLGPNPGQAPARN